jgi:hypothetical protein
MAGFVVKNAYVSLNGTDQSAYVMEVNLNLNVAMLDATVMGATTTAEAFEAGLKTGQTFTVKFKQETADAGLNEDLYDIWNSATAVAFILKANGATTGVTNPKWTGSCWMPSWNPINGAVGALATFDCTFQITGAVTRAEAD